jgi:hypothetical protein
MGQHRQKEEARRPQHLFGPRPLPDKRKNSRRADKKNYVGKVGWVNLTSKSRK